jgi:hypothetical protein
MKKILVLLMAILTVSAFGGLNVANADNALSLVLDGSGSIDAAEWQTQLQGYANTITDATMIPQNGTVAINVIQFSSTAAVEIGFVVIDSAATANTLATQILNINQTGGGTYIDRAIDLSLATLQAFDPGGTYRDWVIDVSTDGYSAGDVQGSADAARAAGVHTVNALTIALGSNATPWADRTWEATDWTDFEATLREKIRTEVQAPVCGDGIADPGEICGEPGLEAGCPVEAPICQDCIDCGIPVELLDFQAIGGGSIVTLAWETAAEIDTAGFNLLRSDSQDGEYGKINAVLIPAKGGPTQGATYSYIDNDVLNGVTYWYRLEDVDIAGESLLHDPVGSVTPAGGSCAAGSTAEASAIGRAPTAGSRLFNSIAVVLVPIGAVLILRRRRRR